MTALADNHTPAEAHWKYKVFTLTSGEIAYQGSAICFRPSTGKCVVAPDDGSGDDLIFLGFSVGKVDASAADKDVNVDLIDELHLHWFANAAGGDAVASTDRGKDCYLHDDQTVSITSEGKPLAGRVWAVDATKGVLVEKRTPGTDLARQPALPAFAANDCVPTAIVHGAIYDVPATAGASTVTLPAAAPDGTVAYFVADGVKNAHTVQYRDATGPTNLTAALTLAKRHMVVVTKRDGAWFANAHVSP